MTFLKWIVVFELAATVAGVVPLTAPVNVPAEPLNEISLYVRETAAATEFDKVKVPDAVVPTPAVPTLTDVSVIVNAALTLLTITKNKAKVKSINLFMLTSKTTLLYLFLSSHKPFLFKYFDFTEVKSKLRAK